MKLVLLIKKIISKIFINHESSIECFIALEKKKYAKDNIG